VLQTVQETFCCRNKKISVDHLNASRKFESAANLAITKMWCSKISTQLGNTCITEVCSDKRIEMCFTDLLSLVDFSCLFLSTAIAEDDKRNLKTGSRVPGMALKN